MGNVNNVVEYYEALHGEDMLLPSFQKITKKNQYPYSIKMIGFQSEYVENMAKVAHTQLVREQVNYLVSVKRFM